MDIDGKLSPEDKLEMEEYNEQMIPNPNFYKINNERPVRDEQISKDHDNFRSELGFSQGLSQYPYPQYSPTVNEYGNENPSNVKRQDSKTKRNSEDFDSFSNTNFDDLDYGSLNDQQNTNKNNLSHEADYKLSKDEQDHPNKPECEKEHQLNYNSQVEQKPQTQHKNKFENELENRYQPQSGISNNYQNTHASETTAHNNNFEGDNEIVKPIADSKENSKKMKAKSKTNFPSKKQSFDTKSRQYPSKHGKSDQLTNEINLKISNRMMSKGLGPSLLINPSLLDPSESGKYYPRMYRHPMNVNVENQHFKDGKSENRNDLNDFTGLQRRLLQFDYEEPMNENDYPLRDNYKAPNEKKSPKIGSIKALNKLSNNDFKAVHSNSSEERSLNESIPGNSTNNKENDIKDNSIPQTKTNQSESNNTLFDHVASTKRPLQLNISSAMINRSNDSTNPSENNDHGKIVKRSASQFGIQG